MKRFLTTLSFIVFESIVLYGGTKYWIRSTTGVWNSSASWSTSSGGSGGAGIPNASDIAIFDGNGLGNCNMGVVTVGGILVNNTYSGTITQSNTITIGNSNAVFSGGTFTGGSSNITCNGTFTLSGTAFTSTSGTLRINNTASFTSGTFNHNNGTVTFGGSTNYNISGNFLFYNLIMIGNFNVITLSNPITVSHDYTQDASLATTSVDFNTLTVNNLTTLKGSFPVILNSGTLVVLGDILTTFTGDPFNSGTATILISGTGSQTMTTTSGIGLGILSNVTIDKPLGDLTLSGTISLFGTWNYVQGNVDAISNMTTIMFPSNGGSSFIDGQGTSSTMTFNNITVGGGTGLNLLGDLIVNNFNVNTNGGLNGLAWANSYDITLFGNFNCMNSTSFFPGTGTVIFAGSGPQSIYMDPNTGGCTVNYFNKLKINTSGTNDVTLLTNNYWVTNTLDLVSGNVNLNGQTLTLGTSGTNTGTLSYTSGWLYGGSFCRWYNSTSFAIGNSKGHFPLGTPTTGGNDYRPLWIGLPSAPTIWGCITVQHNPVYALSTFAAGHNDASWAAGTVVNVVSQDNWLVSTSSGFTANNIDISYGGTGFSNFGGPSYCDASLLNNCVGAYSTSTGSSANMLVARTGLSLANLNNTFHIGVVVMPLPVSFVGFWATPNGSEVDLEWKTLSETNNDFFTVEKTIDGVTFIPVLTTPANTSSEGIHTYQKTDSNPLPRLSYYRLSQTDKDGSKTIFPMVAVNIISEENISFFPNPCSQNSDLMFRVTNSDQTNFSLTIYDLSGRIVGTEELSIKEYTQLYSITKFKSLAPGCYWINAVSNKGTITGKIIKK